MELNQCGKYYQELYKYTSFKDCLYFIEKEEFKEAYEIANQAGAGMTRALTMYLLKEALDVFYINPLIHLDYVPKNYLYEVKDEGLSIYVDQHIKEIRENAFSYCSIKRIIIGKGVENIGENALCLNEGVIEYEGKKDEFISKFLGKTNCFKKSHRNQQIICQDGVIEISK